MDPRNLARHGVSEDELKEALAELPGKVLLLLDSCHSGKVGEFEPGHGDLLHPGADERDPLTDEVQTIIPMRQRAQQWVKSHGLSFAVVLVDGAV